MSSNFKKYLAENKSRIESNAFKSKFQAHLIAGDEKPDLNRFKGIFTHYLGRETNLQPKVQSKLTGKITNNFKHYLAENNKKLPVVNTRIIGFNAKSGWKIERGPPGAPQRFAGTGGGASGVAEEEPVDVSAVGAPEEEKLTEEMKELSEGFGKLGKYKTPIAPAKRARIPKTAVKSEPVSSVAGGEITVEEEGSEGSESEFSMFSTFKKEAEEKLSKKEAERIARMAGRKAEVKEKVEEFLEEGEGPVSVELKPTLKSGEYEIRGVSGDTYEVDIYDDDEGAVITKHLSAAEINKLTHKQIIGQNSFAELTDFKEEEIIKESSNISKKVFGAEYGIKEEGFTIAENISTDGVKKEILYKLYKQFKKDNKDNSPQLIIKEHKPKIVNKLYEIEVFPIVQKFPYNKFLTTIEKASLDKAAGNRTPEIRERYDKMKTLASILDEKGGGISIGNILDLIYLYNNLYNENEVEKLLSNDIIPDNSAIYQIKTGLIADKYFQRVRAASKTDLGNYVDDNQILAKIINKK